MMETNATPPGKQGKSSESDATESAAKKLDFVRELSDRVEALEQAIYKYEQEITKLKEKDKDLENAIRLGLKDVQADAARNLKKLAEKVETNTGKLKALNETVEDLKNPPSIADLAKKSLTTLRQIIANKPDTLGDALAKTAPEVLKHVVKLLNQKNEKDKAILSKMVEVVDTKTKIEIVLLAAETSNGRAKVNP